MRATAFVFTIARNVRSNPKRSITLIEFSVDQCKRKENFTEMELAELLNRIKPAPIYEHFQRGAI